ncbi:MAG TPA: hypothetical protein GXX36_03710 [Clostridiaceae bacterium]|nr:hypothetical protein [Clostridiaceae bacterium]
MRLRNVIFSATIIFVFITSTISAYAKGITLDGQFNDWSDKPGLTDPQGDEEPPEDILSVKWFPDVESGNLYLYVERLELGDKKNDKDKDKDGNDDDDEYIDENEIYNDIINNLLPGGNPRFEYWVLDARFSSEKGDRLAVIVYHPPSRKVSVHLYDEDGDYLWSVTGKWGEDKKEGKRIEFYIPFSQLVGSIQSGYFIKLFLRCENDRVPDSGEIIISTVSTFPVLTVTILGMFVVSGLIIFGLKRRYALKMLN